MESTGKFKDVLQGTYEKGQRFWKKFRILLCCKLLNSKGKDFVNDKNKQVQGIYILPFLTVLRIHTCFLFQLKNISNQHLYEIV